MTIDNAIRLLEEDKKFHDSMTFLLRLRNPIDGYTDYLVSEALKLAVEILKKEMSKNG